MSNDTSNPADAWSVYTDAPLRGLRLAREAGRILAWDESDQITLYDLDGEPLAEHRFDRHLIHATQSDDGSLIAALVEGDTLLLFTQELEVRDQREVVYDACHLATDTLGRYVAIASKSSAVQFVTRHGRSAGKFEPKQPIESLTFVPDRPLLLGATVHGVVCCYQLAVLDSAGRLDAELLWQHALQTNLGPIVTTGDGAMTLVACYHQGIQRYDAKGHHEGSYHVGGTATQAAIDFAGRVIAVASLEGELALLNRSGNVRWKSVQAHPMVALECDALGRYLVVGLSTGEIQRIDVQSDWQVRGGHSGGSEESGGSGSGGGRGGKSRGASSTIRSPAWTLPVAASDEQAATAALTVLDDPPRIGVLLGKNNLQVYLCTGQRVGLGPEMLGVGRLLKTSPGWIAAATDRSVVLHDARRNTFQRVDISLVELTHLAILPDSYGLALVQERDRVGRATISGRWIWRHELKRPIEEMAISAQGDTVVTSDDGSLMIFDPSGQSLPSFQNDPEDPLLVVDAGSGLAEGIGWVTLARRSQMLRGHAADGAVLWRASIPWEPWQLTRIGDFVVAIAVDSKIAAYDFRGRLLGQARPIESSGLTLGLDGSGALVRVVSRGVHLLCTTLQGDVLWRSVSDQPVGPMAAGRTGVAVMIGRELTWFPHPQSEEVNFIELVDGS